MLDSLYIKNFRLFKTLEIDKLSNVNFIVGKNNSGKSCLLEALRVYATNASPVLLYDLISERGQDWELRFKSNEELAILPIENPLRHLFYGYKFPDINDNFMEIGSLHIPENRVKLYVSLYKNIETESGSKRVKIDEFSEDNFSLEDTERILEIETSESKKLSIRLNNKDILDYQKYRRNLHFSTSGIQPRYNVQIVPTNHISDRKIERLWDNINTKRYLRYEVFNALQLIDKNIQEIVLVNRSRDIAPILIYNDEREIPLKSLGDGITHLFHVILALVNAKDGLLLIDEFENGLHYSVQSKLWDLIFQLSEKLNVQVVATTHSKDCINAFEEIWKKYPDRATFYRLDNYISETEVMPYDRDSLGDILAINGEVR